MEAPRARKHLLGVALLALGCAWSAVAAAGYDPAALKRGEYLFYASGGCGCHVRPKSDDKTLSGGRALKTPFGVYYSSNITSDKDAGIGGWSADDFYNAMTHGVRPDGANLFPTFPYTSFTHMRRADVYDLQRYVATLPPSPRRNQEPGAPFPFNIRAAITPWKWLFLDAREFSPDPTKSAEWNRGAYLATAIGHCTECHSPRNLLGAVVKSRYLGGAAEGPEGKVPNITPAAKGIGNWDVSDIVTYMKTGMTPDGDFAGGIMAELIDDGYQHMTDEDLQAIAVYLKSVPPLDSAS